MRAVIIIFITLCLISGQGLCFRVIGCAGGSLMFKCLYKNQNDEHKEKYFCRDRSCKVGISTEIQHHWFYKERFALYDDENSRFFTVFIRNLNIEDEWEYICGNNQTWNHNVDLVVKRETTTSDAERETSQDKEKSKTTTSYAERETSQDKEKSKTTTSVTERKTSQDKEKSGSSMIVAVSVGLILLAVCLTLVLFIIKYNRKHGIVSLTPAQLPTILSDGLLYTAVSFQKHEESLSDAALAVSNEEIHSDYTTVIYHIMPNSY